MEVQSAGIRRDTMPPAKSAMPQASAEPMPETSGFR